MVVSTSENVTHQCEYLWREMRFFCKKMCPICQCRHVFAGMVKCKTCQVFVHKTCALGPVMIPEVLPLPAKTKTVDDTTMPKDVPKYSPEKSSLPQSPSDISDSTVNGDGPRGAISTPAESVVPEETLDPVPVAAVLVDVLTRPPPPQVSTGIEAAKGQEYSAPDSPSSLAPITAVDCRPPTNADPKPRADSLKETLKFWIRRYSLFHRFNDGILLNEQCFYSVCPEILARHIAKRCTYGTVLDPFCGAGGNAIQLALNGSKVIAIDIDERMIKLARRNAKIYGVEDRIDFRVGDCFRIAREIRADAIVTSPPWGGPGYARKSRFFDAQDLCSREAGGMAAILRLSRKISQRVVLHVPKSIDHDQCLRLARNAGCGYVEFEKVNIDGYLNAINIYLKQMIDTTRKPPAAVRTTITLKTPPMVKNLKTTRQHWAKSDMKEYQDHINKVDEYLNGRSTSRIPSDN